MVEWSALHSLLLAIAGLLVAVGGLRMIGKSSKARMGEVFSQSAVMIFGIMFVALGLGTTTWIAFGQGFLSMFGVKTG